jgi:hypothetical protein
MYHQPLLNSTCCVPYKNLYYQTSNLGQVTCTTQPYPPSTSQNHNLYYPTPTHEVEVIQPTVLTHVLLLAKQAFVDSFAALYVRFVYQ